MFKSNIIIAWRNLVKNKTFSLLNISGLAVGMGVALLIGLWLWDEFSFDRSFPAHERIARVMQTKESNGKLETNGLTPYPLAAALRKDYGDRFEHVVLASSTWEHVLDLGNKRFSYTGVFMEPDAPHMLDLDIVAGSSNALTDPRSIMVSESVARAIFGKEPAVGQIIRLDRSLDVKVAAVYRDPAKNSSFRDLGFIAPWALYFDNTPWIKLNEDPWRPNAFATYVRLRDHVDMEEASVAIADVRFRNVSPRLRLSKPRLHLHQMTRWHLYDEFTNGVNSGGRIQYVWLFLTIGVFVLILACINFINLSTARSEKRAKEVGIRKTIGSVRSQLVFQFFFESVLFVAIAFIISLLLVQMALPLFNEVSGKQMNVPWTQPLFWLSAFSFCLFTALIAGLYPALYLSSFKPIKVLKGSFKQGKLASLPRQVLVVVQFTVSIVLIIGTVVVFRQVDYAKNRPVGYNRDGLITISIPDGGLKNGFAVMRQELLNAGHIIEMAEANAAATDINSTSTGFEWEGKDQSAGVEFPVTRISHGYGKTLGWEFIAGRDFDLAIKTDSAGLIINETAATFMGFGANAVGKTISWDGEPMIVLGVVKDVIAESPYANVRASVYCINEYPGNVLMVRLHPKTSVQAATAQMEQLFKRYFPDHNFGFRFVNEAYNEKFGDEQRIGTLAGFFAALAIFISCLGLFGMASFVAVQRNKEIGVRKVLGASVFSLWKLLSQDFVKLVLLSLVLAVPIAYYFMNQWLQNYVYRPELSAWIFIGAGAGAIFISLLTVSYQSLKSALSNPVISLKSE